MTEVELGGEPVFTFSDRQETLHWGEVAVADVPRPRQVGQRRLRWLVIRNRLVLVQVERSV